MDILQQGTAIAWGFAWAAIGIVCTQIWSWIVYSRFLSDIAEKRRELQRVTDPVKKTNLLAQFATEQSPLASRIQLVNEAVLRKRSVGLQELSVLTEEEDSRQWYVILPNTAISIFLIAGLAGTIYLLQALLGSVFKDGEKIIQTSGQLDALKMADIVNKLYPGFSHVFGVTYSGILCTLLVLIVRNVLIHRKRTAFFQAIDTFTIELLLPIEVKLTDVLAPFIKSMGDLASTIMESSRKNTIAIYRASKANAEAIKEVGRLNVAMGIANLKTAQTALEAVNNLGQFSTAMTEAAREMRQASQALASSNALLSTTFAADGQWAKLHDALAISQTKLNDSLGDVQLKMGTLCTDVTGLRGAAETLAAVDYQGLQTKLGGLSNSLNSSDIVWTQLRQTHENLLKGLSTNPNSLNNTFMTLHKTVASLGPQIIEQQATLNTTLEGFSIGFATIDKNLPPLQSSMHKAATNLLQVCASITDLKGLQDGISKLDFSLRSASEAYASLATTQKATGDEMASRQSELQSSMVSLQTAIADFKRQIENSQSDIANTATILKGIHSTTVLMTKIDFTNLQKLLDALLVNMATARLHEALPSLHKDMLELSGLLRTWINTADSEKTPDKLDAILIKLQKLEVEHAKAGKTNRFQ
ncbi:MAG: hypothetical protein ACKN9T_15125 [Candidatus Methylumidiphilus sp.]